MLKSFINTAKVFITYWLLSIFCFLILRIIIGYTTFEDNVQFLAVKQDYISDPIWKTAFYIHVFSAFLSLLAGFTQFSKTILKDYRKLHRAIGKIYVFNILIINFPIGMILAINANGQLWGKTAFILLDIVWAYFTFVAIGSAYKKNFIKHRNYMLRSYALTLSAITLRLWHFILIKYFIIDSHTLYIMEAWLGFIPNLLICEIIIKYKNYRTKFTPK